MPPLATSRKRAVALSLIMACLPSAAPSLAAPAPQDARRAERERLGRVMEASADVEDFRRELSAYFDELAGVLRLANSVPAVRRKFAAAGFRPLASLAESKSRLAQLSHADLTQLRAAYAANPGWREAPSAFGSLLKPALLERIATAAASSKSDIPRTAEALTTDNCADGLAAGITNTDISIAEAAVIAAEGVMEAIPSDSISAIARAVAVAAVSAVKGTSLALQTLKAIADDCSGAAFEASIQQQLTDARNALVANDNANAAAVVANDDANRATIVANSDANRVAVVANDNANRTTIVNNDNANKNAVVANDNANTTYLLRVAIEADLSSNDGNVPVALFETPETICAGAAPFNQCGLLGATRGIVVQTIARLAGSSTAQANSFLAKGDDYRTAGNYRAAYQQYRQAYKAAAR